MNPSPPAAVFKTESSRPNAAKRTPVSKGQPMSERTISDFDRSARGFGVPFASCYAYSPRGVGAASVASRQLCLRVKNTDPEWLPRYVECLRDRGNAFEVCADIFRHDALLVPVPSWKPTADTEVWGASCLVTVLREMGIPGVAWKGLSRTRPLWKSSAAWPAERPTVKDHHDSLAVGHLSTPPARIVLVDDVITRGRTLLGAAVRLRERFPVIEIHAFALLRTLSPGEEVERLLMPCSGRIAWTGRDARRTP